MKLILLIAGLVSTSLGQLLVTPSYELLAMGLEGVSESHLGISNIKNLMVFFDQVIASLFEDIKGPRYPLPEAAKYDVPT